SRAATSNSTSWAKSDLDRSGSIARRNVNRHNPGRYPLRDRSSIKGLREASMLDGLIKGLAQQVRREIHRMPKQTGFERDRDTGRHCKTVKPEIPGRKYPPLRKRNLKALVHQPEVNLPDHVGNDQPGRRVTAHYHQDREAGVAHGFEHERLVRALRVWRRSGVTIDGARPAGGRSMDRKIERQIQFVIVPKNDS